VPILYFCFNRKACEKNAERHSDRNFLSGEETKRVESIVDELIRRFSLEDYNKLEGLKSLWFSGCAFHHAGMLPAVKEIVERLFTEGLIKLLFCTETFALGINMPAKTVIFDELERFNGVDFQYLSTRQYMQMAGRSGRRGMDEKGFVYSLIIPEATSPKEILRLFQGKSEKIKSRFFASYSSILTLYNRFGEDALNLFRKSLGNYGKSEDLTSFYEKEEDQIKKRIEFLQHTGFLEGKDLTPKGALAARANGYEIQTAELYYSRSLDQCTPLHMCIVFAGLITEDKKRRLPPPSITFEFPGEKVVRHLKREEKKFGIRNTIPEMNFAFASAVYSWASGSTLSEIIDFGIPEGDLVRVLRMTIQLMRTLAELIEDPVTIDKLHQGIRLINRDVVDAQAELEASV
ncbi:MAG: helicase-related protein, partial [Chitinivibrionales bacterium]